MHILLLSNTIFSQFHVNSELCVNREHKIALLQSELSNKSLLAISILQFILQFSQPLLSKHYSFSLFQGRACQQKDYYLWELTDLRNSSQHCSLGRKQKFERRLADTKCYNGYNYDRPVQVSNCLCTREDFTWYVIPLSLFD